ncbi:MAG TPA: hypothetical protein VMV69_14365 [Pirellulales bacterium]|nr:hypothetical protein [Pirellulales bacterium]
MIAAPTTALLGIGLYTVDEAARYARLTPASMKRWVWGSSKGAAIINPQLDPSEKLITFLDFVQMLAVRSVRVCEKSISVQRIRKAHDSARDRYNVTFPLARQHKLFLFGPREKPTLCELVIRLNDIAEPSGEYVVLTGNTAGNRMISEIAEPFMMGLRYDGGELPIEYQAWPLGGKETDGRRIIISPHHSLGEPFLPSCGYTARALWDAVKSEGGIDHAAKVYDIDIEDVQLVYEYFDYLLGTDAA